MSELKKEIVELHEHVSQLYMMLKQLSEYVGCKDINEGNLTLDPQMILKLSNASVNGNGHHLSQNSFQSKHHYDYNSVNDNLYLLNKHKDILVDDESVHSSSPENEPFSDIISCEEQVNRLTAQLTAAYYRIASLEDQLLALRNQLETGENSFYKCQ